MKRALSGRIHSDVQVTGLLYFLGVESVERRCAIYWDIHSPENEARFGNVKVTFKK